MSKMNETIRTEVWDQMTDADRLARYYGAVADKMGRRERLAAVVTTAFAVGSTLGFGLKLASWITGVLILGTLVASLWPLVYRSAGSLTSVVLCHKRVCRLQAQLKALWLDVESDAIDDRDARARLRDLSSQISEVSGVTTGAVRYYEKIRSRTETETDAYWTKWKEREGVSASQAPST